MKSSFKLKSKKRGCAIVITFKIGQYHKNHYSYTANDIRSKKNSTGTFEIINDYLIKFHSTFFFFLLENPNQMNPNANVYETLRKPFK